MDAAVTILPIAPGTFWTGVALAGVLALSAAVWVVLSQVGAPRWTLRVWDRVPPDWRVVVALALTVLALFVVAALGAAAVVLWHTVMQALTATSEGPNLGAGALIAAILGAPFLIWGTVIKQRALGFQKEGHITDRISKAVEQLGAEKTVKRPLLDDAGNPRRDKDDKPIVAEQTVPNIEVRIGGILSLERIAQDSTIYDQGRDHVRVMEILCAYIRENAPASEAKDHPDGEWVPLKDDATKEEREAHLAKRKERFGEYPFLSTGLDATWAAGLPPPREDIAQALNVIGRRNGAQLRAEARWGKAASPNAEWVYATPCPILPDRTDGTALPKEELDAYRKELATWQKHINKYRGYQPDLRGTNLQSADLSQVLLAGARLQGARMEGAILWQAGMEGANLGEARMEGAYLGQARMEGAYLRQARMEGAYLQQARMEGAYLWQARMEGADLRKARMEGADLRQAQMQGANLREVQMDSRTDLTGAVLTGAAMRFVDLRDVPINQEQLDAVFRDGSVTGKLPQG